MAAPHYGHGVPKNTLTWQKKNLYIIIKIFYLFTLKKKKEHPQKKKNNNKNTLKLKKKKERKAQTKISTKIWRKKIVTKQNNGRPTQHQVHGKPNRAQQIIEKQTHRFKKKKPKIKTQYTLLQPNLKKLEQPIHQVKQN